MGTVYSKEFKDQIVQLHRGGGRTFMELAKEFDLSATTVGNWVREANKRDSLRAKAARRADGKAPIAEEPVESDKAMIARLERELARKTEELEILGKALAFFARRMDP
jgi:transposase